MDEFIDLEGAHLHIGLCFKHAFLRIYYLVYFFYSADVNTLEPMLFKFYFVYIFFCITIEYWSVMDNILNHFIFKCIIALFQMFPIYLFNNNDM